MDELLLWRIDATSGFDSAWVSFDGGRLRATGQAVGIQPEPYSVDYELETGDDYVHRRIQVRTRSRVGNATLELVRDQSGWTLNGEPRPDLAEAVDCDLAACPLANTMPVLRHDLHLGPGDVTFTMAFINVPTLTVVPIQQRYEHLRRTDEGGAVVRFRSGDFQSDVVFDARGLVVDYPRLGRRLAAG